jgi:hypothetical protein
MQVVSNGFFWGKFSSPGNKKNGVQPTQSICVKYFCAPKNAPKLPEFEEYFGLMYFEANILYNGLCHNIPALFTS